jgi:MFS family permease
MAGPPRMLHVEAWRRMALLVAATAIDAADAALLPPMFSAISSSFGVGPVALSAIMLAQSLSLALSGPAWALFADRVDRFRLLTLACTLWGVWTCLTATTKSLSQLVVVRALVGNALSALAPVINSIIGDFVEPQYRGRAFGAYSIARMIGSVGGGAFATRFARGTLLGMDGWRGVNVVLGLSSLTLAALCSTLPAEPPRWLPSGGKRIDCAAAAEPIRLLRATPSAMLIVGQGVVGGVPWSGFSFTTMMLQAAGFADADIAVAGIVGGLCAGLGSALGGVLGDLAAAHQPTTGRVYVAQLTTAVGIPLVGLQLGLGGGLLNGLPTSSTMGAHVTAYTAAVGAVGLLATWGGTATNLPIMTEVVPARQRASVMAVTGTLEAASSALFGGPIVGLLAEHVYGFHEGGTAAEGPDNARALCYAMLTVTPLPWLICIYFFGLIAHSYAGDREAARRADAAAALPVSSSLV